MRSPAPYIYYIGVSGGACASYIARAVPNARTLGTTANSDNTAENNLASPATRGYSAGGMRLATRRIS